MAAAPHNPPFRAELIGSLIRPQAIKDARHAHDEGKLTSNELRQREDDEIQKLVALQEDIGFGVVTDGEQRRNTYSDSFTTHGITGLKEGEDVRGSWAYTNESGDTVGQRTPKIVDKIRWAGPTNVANFEFLATCATRALPKVTLPGPAYIHYRAGRDNISKEIYPNLDDFWSDLIEAYRQEINALAAAGCRYIQLDETSIAKLGDPTIRDSLAQRDDNWQDLLEVYTDAVNAVTDNVPTDMTVGIHLCRGNKAGHWQADGGYDAVAEKLFRKLRLNFYFLEYDSPRAGSFEPLSALPDDKTVVIGAMTTKSPELESVDFLKSRIMEAAKVVDLDRLCISPQCGFSSSVEGVMNEEQEHAKLSRLIEVANDIWGGT
ncbi:MAG: 5-methyltetrahydropteroyltriglutamate--homocysteine methyltransferase [Gammaproteobacteria bacterium]|jgi:5-methyltetrahydropteroyltriglutamate--homocysteine methyltransferase